MNLGAAGRCADTCDVPSWGYEACLSCLAARALCVAGAHQTRLAFRAGEQDAALHHCGTERGAQIGQSTNFSTSLAVRGSARCMMLGEPFLDIGEEHIEHLLTLSVLDAQSQV